MDAPFKRLRLRPIFLVLSALCIFVTAACGDKQEKPAGPPPAPVALDKASSMDMPYYIMAVGQVNTLESVTVRSRVTGYLQKKHFRQGEFVKEGQPLFTIDPSTYLANIKSLQAQLASDKTSYEQARRDYNRYSRLLKQAVVSKEDYEQKRLDMRTAEDKISMTEAELANAKNDLTYCYISSPLSGLSGYIWPSVGDLIEANEDELVIINQIQPIAVDFHIPQRYLPEIKKYIHQSETPLTVLAILPGEDEPEKGALAFYDNTVNKDTGTIWLEANFPNERNRLWPGNYVQARLEFYEQKNAVAVPHQATCLGPRGKYIWVAHPQNKTVEMRPVEVARRSGKWDVIASGLKAGEVIVTDGQLRLYPGATYYVAPSPDERPDEEDAGASNQTRAPRRPSDGQSTLPPGNATAPAANETASGATRG
ncbi:MAG: rane fusion protein multidrug efflux system [Desulfovibrionales bacterium]|nr:rane fusion protein multidrug efflux system [Desulfovibrionales bacterium]